MRARYGSSKALGQADAQNGIDAPEYILWASVGRRGSGIIADALNHGIKTV